MLHFSNQYPPKTVVVRNIKGSTQTIILYLQDAKRVKTSQPQLMWQFLRATSICFRKLWYNASGFTHGVTPIGFANFRDWVEGPCHKKCAVWHVNKWGWVKTLVPSEPQVIAGIYGCSSHYSNVSIGIDPYHTQICQAGNPTLRENRPTH